jgi:hypothetical protein
MRKLPEDGNVRHALRQFNQAPSVFGKARSVRDLAISLGFDVSLCRLPKGMAGRLVQDPFSQNGYRIEVNEKGTIQSQRWAVLHEIGHFFLHVDRADPFAVDMHLDRSSNAFYADLTQEREANEFAEALLFDDGALRAATSLRGGNVANLAHHFGVSERVIEIALNKFCNVRDPRDI